MSSYVCEELIDKIFERLPVKTLLRCRSLSKSWCSRIASPDFIRKHTLQLANTPQKVLIQQRKIEKDGFKKDISTLHSKDQLPSCPRVGYRDLQAVKLLSPHFKIIGSCNGVFLVLDPAERISLWNFSIRCGLTLPNYPFWSVYTKGTEFGFGFDPRTDDYKIVSISYSGEENNSFLYSMKTRTWYEISSPTTKFIYVAPCACFINGALHWTVNCQKTESLNVPHHMIMTFNLSSHVFGNISLCEARWATSSPTIINDSLAVMSTKGLTTWIWVLKEYDNVTSWSAVYKVNTKQFDGALVLKPIINGDLLLGKTGCYKVYNTTTRVLSRLSTFKGFPNIVEMVTYVESLELFDKATPYNETISISKTKLKREAKKKIGTKSNICY